MAGQIGKYPNLKYICDECLTAEAIPSCRRVYHKLTERKVTLGKLLDDFDANNAKQTPTTETNSVETQTIHNISTAEKETLTSASTAEKETQSNERPPTTQSTVSATCAPSTAKAPSVQQLDIDNTEGNASVLTVEDFSDESEPVIVKGRQDPRSNFYMFSFSYDGVNYRSLEHAYQSLKAIMCGEKSLAWRIRRAPSPQAAKKLADQLPRIAMKKLHDLMFDLLKAKVSQCYSFRRSLRETGLRKIFHSTYKDVDLYWCTGLNFKDIEAHKGDYDGLNVFGKMLEKIRDEHLQSEHEYETRMQCLETDRYVILLHDGEESMYPSSFYGQNFCLRGSGYHRYRY
jgi:ribA/ribD-fused uncharacterized protein